MVKLLGGEIEKADLLRKIGRIEQVAGARPVKLASGKAEGIKVEKEDIENEYSTLMSSLQQTYNITEDELINKCNITKEDIEKELEKEFQCSWYGIWSLLSWWNAVYVWPWQYWTKLCG